MLAKRRNPGARVVLLEASTIGWAASGRNGGFCEASLTHGEENGRSRWPEEYDALERLGADNLDAFEADVHELGLDCQFERTGQLAVAVEEHQVEWLRESAALPRRGRRTRAEIDSPLFLAGEWSRDDCALVHPARLARELARVATDLGVEIHEHTRVTGLDAPTRGPVDVTHHRRLGHQRPGRAGHQRLPLAAASDPADDGAGLRLRADDRAAHRRPARLHRLGQPAGPRRPGQPVPLLPADRRQPDPLGRVRRDLPLRRPGAGVVRGAPGDLPTGWPRTSSRRSRSWRA